MSTLVVTSKKERFVKEFISSIKHLRYLLEPGAVQRRLGEHPGAQPLNMRAYQTIP